MLTIDIREVLVLLRPNQWYKNLLVFLALIFSGNLFNQEYFLSASLGFAVLCIISSANYIVNDLVDSDRDSMHPVKKNRPFASGKVPKSGGMVISILLFSIGLTGAFLLDKEFFMSVVLIVAVCTVYSLLLKRVVLMDLAAVSAGFVLRAVSGAVVIDVYFSKWLVAGVMVLALFLVTGKRWVELKLLKGQAQEIREVYSYYNRKMLIIMMRFFLIILLGIFVLYTLEHKLLIYTLPLFIYSVSRYYLLVIKGKISHPENAFRDLPFAAVILLFAFCSIILIYI